VVLDKEIVKVSKSLVKQQSQTSLYSIIMRSFRSKVEVTLCQAVLDENVEKRMKIQSLKRSVTVKNKWILSLENADFMSIKSRTSAKN